MKVRCPGCGGIIQVKQELIGKRLKCRCSQVFQVGASSESKLSPRPPSKAVGTLRRETSPLSKKPLERQAKKVYSTSVLSKVLSVGMVGSMGMMFLLGTVGVFLTLDENYQYQGRNLLITIGFMLLIGLWFVAAAASSAFYRVVVMKDSIEAKGLFGSQRIAISNVAYVECNNGMVFRFRDRNNEELGCVTSFFRGLGEFDSWVKRRFNHSDYGMQY